MSHMIMSEEERVLLDRFSRQEVKMAGVGQIIGRFAAVSLTIAALGLWVAPGSSTLLDVQVIKAFTSLFMVTVAVYFWRLADTSEVTPRVQKI